MQSDYKQQAKLALFLPDLRVLYVVFHLVLARVLGDLGYPQVTPFFTARSAHTHAHTHTHDLPAA